MVRGEEGGGEKGERGGGEGHWRDTGGTLEDKGAKQKCNKKTISLPTSADMAKSLDGDKTNAVMVR